MGAKKISDQEFIDLWNEHQSITKIAAVTGMDLRGLKRRHYTGRTTRSNQSYQEGAGNTEPL